MAELKHRIELTMEHRDLILQYGYVSGRLEAALRRWPMGQAIRRVGMTGAELHLLIGDLSYSYNPRQSGSRSRSGLGVVRAPGVRPANRRRGPGHDVVKCTWSLPLGHARNQT